MLTPRRASLIALTLTALSAPLSTAFAQDANLLETSRSYKSERDYESLAILTDTLEKGMPQRDVKRLLGEPDYSPTDGQFYYGSDTQVEVDPDLPHFTLVLVVNYGDDTGEITDRLQNFFLGPVGE